MAGTMGSVLSLRDVCTDDLPDDENWEPNEKARARLDFAIIPPLADSLLGLLATEVTFTKGRFS